MRSVNSQQSTVYSKGNRKSVVSLERLSSPCAMTKMSNTLKPILVVALALSILFYSTASAAHFNYRVITPDMVGEDIYYLQTMLQQLGYYSGPINEHYDHSTQRAVTQFQGKYKLPVTGMVDNNTAQAILSVVNQPANLVVDEQYLMLPSPPVFHDNRIFVSVTALSHWLGYKVEEISDDLLEITFHQHTWLVSINDNDHENTLIARRQHGQLYLPIRTLADLVGATVDWHGTTRTAYIRLPHGFGPHGSSEEPQVRRVTYTSYPDHLRLTLRLASVQGGQLVPGRLNYNKTTNTWVAKLTELTMMQKELGISINDPLIGAVFITHDDSEGLTLTIHPRTDSILNWQWTVTPAGDKMVLELFR